MVSVVALVFGMAYGGVLGYWYRGAVEDTRTVQRELDAQAERLGLLEIAAQSSGLPTKEGETPVSTEGLEPVVRNVDDKGIEVLASWPAGEVAYRLREGFEIVPTALVDAVLDPRTPCGGSEYIAARRALRAYRAPVLLGQTEETP